LSEPAYTARGLSLLPPFLSSDFGVRRSATKDKVEEILVAELGDPIGKNPYLILRSGNGDITVYQPYQYLSSVSKRLRFLKISQKNQSISEDAFENTPRGRRQRMRAISSLGGHSVVFCVGKMPQVIIKTAKSQPQSYHLTHAVMYDVCPLENDNCEEGLVFIDEKLSIRAAKMSQSLDYSGGWIAEKLASGIKMDAFEYHNPTDRYIIGSSKPVPWRLPEDELHPEWSSESATLLPMLEQATIELLVPGTGSVIDRHDLEIGEVITCMHVMELETSEISSNIKPLIAVGTAIVKGEEINTQGKVYIFDMISVVPDPGVPASGQKLKLIATETVKGAVTALSSIGTEGFFLVAQGQKAIVRGLKEDGSMLPVAFLDTQCYVSAVKELAGTGLCLIGDAMKGIWLTGYSVWPILYYIRLHN
jgi:cleavage and polyadenylation specificity factor subunit 1